MMFRFTELSLLCIFVVFSKLTSATSECVISINEDLTSPQPLVLVPMENVTQEDFFLPSTKDMVIFKGYDILEVACPFGGIRLKQGSAGKEMERFICNNRKFEINGVRWDFKDVTCSVEAKHFAKYTGRSCLEEHREIEIGFHMEYTERFISLMSICFDERFERTLYSTFNLTKSIGAYQTNFPRPADWISGIFFTTSSVDDLYSRKTQRSTINTLVGLPIDSTKYVAESGDLFLSRGHLTAKADFIYGSQQSATFYFINAAPQWQSFNGGNWNSLEIAVRNFAAITQQDLLVYTGTYDILTLPNEESGRNVDIYLDRVNKLIPIPKLFWKVLYEPTEKAGIAFVGLNNPYVKSIGVNDLICKDVCDRINWVEWDRKNITYGYSYCCTVEDFRRTVHTLPNFEVLHLLGSGRMLHPETMFFSISIVVFSLNYFM